MDFSKVFDSVHRGKMDQIFLAYDLPKETVADIMILNKSMKPMVHSTDGDTIFFYIDTGVWQGDTLAPYLFIICLDCVLQILIDLMKENAFTLKKGKKKTISCRNYYGHRLRRWSSASRNTPANYIHYSLVQEAGGIGLHVNSVKTKFICFKQDDDISTFNGKPLKLDDQFT